MQHSDRMRLAWRAVRGSALTDLSARPRALPERRQRTCTNALDNPEEVVMT
jgi:hypothetical protein